MSAHPHRTYLIPSDSPLLKEHEAIIAALKGPENKHKSLSLNVEPEVIETGQTQMFTELIAVLQYYPEVLDNLVFGMRFNFMKSTETEDNLDPTDWKQDPRYASWFRTAQERFPLVVFFLEDRDARFYSLAGDLLNEEETEVEHSEDDSEADISFTSDQMNRLFNRLFQACVLFMHYCAVAGVEPEPAVEALIAEIDQPDVAPFDYEDLKRQFSEDEARGFQFRLNFIPDPSAYTDKPDAGL
jgi:hypothetical protein